MKNKKGFTLIELLGVIVLITVILALAMVTLSGISKKRKEQAWGEVKEEAITAAKEYFTANEHYMTDCSSANCGLLVSVGTLVKQDYLNKVINPISGDAVPDCDLIYIYKTSDGKYNTSYYEKGDLDSLKENGYITDQQKKEINKFFNNKCSQDKDTIVAMSIPLIEDQSKEEVPEDKCNDCSCNSSLCPPTITEPPVCEDCSCDLTKCPPTTQCPSYKYIKTNENCDNISSDDKRWQNYADFIKDKNGWTNTNVCINLTFNDNTTEWHWGANQNNAYGANDWNINESKKYTGNENMPMYAETYRWGKVFIEGTNQKECITNKMFIDKTPPKINGTNNGNEFNIFASDSASGVNKIAYKIDNSDWVFESFDVVKQKSFKNLSTNKTKNDTFVIYLRAYDLAGNKSDITKISYTNDVNSVDVNPYELAGKYFKLKFNLRWKVNGVVKNAYQFAYWKATKTDDTTNNKTDADRKEVCGDQPPKGTKIYYTNDAVTGRLYMRYQKQYYCFAVRPYRKTVDSNINRWTVQYKHAKTTGTVDSSNYNGD